MNKKLYVGRNLFFYNETSTVHKNDIIGQSGYTVSDFGTPHISEALNLNTSENFSHVNATNSPFNFTLSDTYIWTIEPYNEAYIIPIIFGLVFIVGLVGNGTLIFTVAANKVMRNVPNVLIVSLSAGDFLLILFSVPLTSTVYTFTNWPYGEAACKLNHCMQSWSLGVTVFTLMSLSHERYTAIVDPMSKRKGKSNGKTLGILCFTWIASLCLALPNVFLSTQVWRENSLGQRIVVCSEFPEIVLIQGLSTIRIYYVFRFLAFFLIPVVIIATFYVFMARILIHSGKQLQSEGIINCGVSNHQRQIAARKKVAYVVLSFVIIFIVCWLPRHTYIMWFYFDDASYNAFWHYFKIFGFCLTFINSCINPFALYFFSSQFRKYYDMYLFCPCQKAFYRRTDVCSTGERLAPTMRRTSSTQITIALSQSMC